MGMLFLRRNRLKLEKSPGTINFPFFLMQLKNATNRYSTLMKLFFNPTDNPIQPEKGTKLYNE